MLKSVAYIGYGFVGKASHEQFKYNAEALIVDPKIPNGLTISDLSIREPEIAFVSINAPTLENGTVDASVVYKVFEDLSYIGYEGIVVLKSTLPPETVVDLGHKFSELRYVYSPEFLRERSWDYDAVHPSQVILAGDWGVCQDLYIFYKHHSNVWSSAKYVVGMTYSEAALIKYTINCYLASKVTFMNQIYELMSDVNGTTPTFEEWIFFTDTLTNDSRFGESHTSVPGPDGQFGYGGSCFPKDVKAMIGFDTEHRLTVLRETELANTKARLKQ